MSNSLYRFLAILLTGLIYLVTKPSIPTNPPNFNFLSIASAIGFTHYLVSAIYSHKRIKEIYIRGLKRSVPKWLFAMTLLIASIYLGLLQIPLIIVFVFGVHHIFSDLYLFKPKEQSNFFDGTYYSRFTLITLTYFGFIFSRVLPFGIFIGLLIPSLGWFLFDLYRHRSQTDRKTLYDFLAYEILGVVAIVVFWKFPFALIAVVLYHFIEWWFISLEKEKKSRIPLAVGQVAGTIIFMFLLPQFNQSFFTIYNPKTYLIFFAYVHAFTSLSLSSMNPRVLLRLQ